MSYHNYYHLLTNNYLKSMEPRSPSPNARNQSPRAHRRTISKGNIEAQMVARTIRNSFFPQKSYQPEEYE